METAAANIILLLASAYIGAGLIVGVALVVFGLGRLDLSTRGVGVGLRLIILPGVVTLWPSMFHRWLRAGGSR